MAAIAENMVMQAGRSPRHLDERGSCGCSEGQNSQHSGEPCAHEDLAAMVVDVAESDRLQMVAALAVLFNQIESLCDGRLNGDAQQQFARSLAEIRSLCELHH